MRINGIHDNPTYYSSCQSSSSMSQDSQDIIANNLLLASVSTYKTMACFKQMTITAMSPVLSTSPIGIIAGHIFLRYWFSDKKIQIPLYNKINFAEIILLMNGIHLDGLLQLNLIFTETMLQLIHNISI